MKKKRKIKPPLAEETTWTPEGPIRKGNRKPYRKATLEDIELRVTELAEWLQAHPFASRFQVYKQFCKKWKLTWKIIDGYYIGRARKRNKELLRFTVEDAREVGLGVVVRMLDHPAPRIRLRAVKAFTEITGCDAPRRMELTGPGGGPIQTEARPLADISDDRLRELAERGSI